VEVLEDRCSPTTFTQNITDSTVLPLTLPGTFFPGERIIFMLSATSSDSTENTEPEVESLTITSSTGDLHFQAVVGQSTSFGYVAIQPGETFSVTSSDGDEIGTVTIVFPDTGKTFMPGIGGLAFTHEPTTAHVGAHLNPLKVAVLTAHGVIDTTFNGKITIALANDPTSATLQGTLTVKATHGIATFSNLRINTPGTGYTLAASTTVFGTTFQVQSFPFDVLAKGHH
jgi:hypothetical protein